MPRFPLPGKFESGDFTIFKKAFERVAKANKWDDSEQLAALPLALSGRALLAFEAGEKCFETIEEAFEHLAEEFDTSLDKESAMKQFYASRWGNGLDPAVYADQLKALLLRGLPSLNDEDVQRIVCNQLISSFPSTCSEKLSTLFAGKSPRISDVAAAARDLVRTPSLDNQAFALQTDTKGASKIADLEAKIEKLATLVAGLADRSAGEDERHKKVGSMRTSDTQPRTNDRGRPLRCYNCSGVGHISRFCPSPRVPKWRPRSGNEKAGDRLPTTDRR